MSSQYVNYAVYAAICVKAGMHRKISPCIYIGLIHQEISYRCSQYPAISIRDKISISSIQQQSLEKKLSNGTSALIAFTNP